MVYGLGFRQLALEALVGSAIAVDSSSLGLPESGEGFGLRM